MEKKKRILVVTRLVETKWVQHLISAIKDINLDYELNIAGDGPFIDQLKKKAKGSKTKINFLGWIERDSPVLKELYGTSSIFVFPSYYESFGMAILETMAGGQAIIATDVDGCREVLGDTTIFVRPKNS